MAYYHHHSTDIEEDAGSLNSTFNVLVIVALVAFTITSTYFYG